MIRSAVIVGLCLCTVLISLKKIEAGYSERVLLQDIKVLTLYDGKWTNARRSSSIPQLKCVGGTAGCSAFVPQVVQCYNRGSDGYDIQWECRTDMDKAYRFGKIEVSCEGYDYPDDPYILTGSCGLEYRLDATGAGGGSYSRQGNYYSQAKDTYSKLYERGGSTILSFVLLAVGCFVAYKVYVWLSVQQQQPQDVGGDRPYGFPSQPPPPGYSAPPPPGFRPEYMPGSGGGCSSSYADTGSTGGTFGTGTRGATSGGFWTGAATGGLLGYLFGSRNNTRYYQDPGYGSTGWGGSGYGGSGYGGSGWGSGWGAGSSGAFSRPSHSSTSGFGGSSSGSGTRTASGFGGTKRR